MDHLNRIQQAVDYIEEHLQEELEIASIARRAGYSAWHFQRLFAATVGEGVMEYARKRRLTNAFRELSGTDRRILDIALDAGFESQEAFSRAFKARFGRTPGEARDKGVSSVPSLERPKITMAYLDHLYRGINMQPNIVDKEAFTIAGLGAPFISILSPKANNFEVIPALWGRYLPRAKEIQRRGGADYGAVWCEDGSEGRCYYVAGAALAPGASAPAGMETREIPGGKYAVFTHKGPLDKLGHTMSYIHGSWLPKSGFEYRDGPEVEVYGEKFNPSSPDSELEIWVPIGR